MNCLYRDFEGMPKNKPNDTNKDESSKSRADSEARKELFILTSISHLVKWIDSAVLVLQPKYGAIVHELKTGIRTPDIVIQPPNHNANKVVIADYSIKNSNNLRVMEKRNENRQLIIGEIILFIDPATVERLRQSLPYFEINSDLHLVRGGLTNILSMRSNTSDQLNKEAVLKQIHNLKNRNKIMKVNDVNRKIQEMRNIIALNDSFGLEAMPWSDILYSLMCALGGDYSQLYAKWINNENDIKAIISSANGAPLTAPQQERIADMRAWVPTTISQFEDMVIKYQLPQMAGMRLDREHSYYAGSAGNNNTKRPKPGKGKKSSSSSSLTDSSGSKSTISCFLCRGEHHAKECPDREDFERWKKLKKSDSKSSDSTSVRSDSEKK